MTASQRLRLVLTLGIINIVLAGVALGVGISESTNPPIAVVVPTPGVATPTVPGSGTESPAPPQPSPRPPGPPTASQQPEGGPPTPEPTPVVEPSPSAPVEPSPSAPVQPSPSAPVLPAPSAAPTSGPIDAVAPSPQPARGGSNGGPARPNPTPRAEPTPVPAVGTPRTCHASARGVERSDGKACDHKPKKAHADHGWHRGWDAHQTRHHRHHPPATVDTPRRGHKSLHRLRTGRRAR